MNKKSSNMNEQNFRPYTKPMIEVVDGISTKILCGSNNFSIYDEVIDKNQAVMLDESDYDESTGAWQL